MIIHGSIFPFFFRVVACTSINVTAELATISTTTTRPINTASKHHAHIIPDFRHTKQLQPNDQQQIVVEAAPNKQLIHSPEGEEQYIGVSDNGKDCGSSDEHAEVFGDEGEDDTDRHRDEYCTRNSKHQVYLKETLHEI